MIILQQTRGLLSSNDQLALDLPLAETKSINARVGPTPVFTRASTATFIGSDGLIQSAAINAARFDHDPVTLASKGLLIEESRTNQILRSEDFASASWAKGGGSFSSVANVNVDGSANSELFSEDGTTGNHRIFQAFVGTTGTVYTLSVFLKFNGRAQVSLENRSITGNPSARFNIQNGTIEVVNAALTATIKAYPNGWYRCSITGTATLNGGNYLLVGNLAGSQSYTGIDGPAFYVYGAQVEAGANATSYIPTVASTVVRSMDVCSITGANFSGSSFYNQSEGTVIGEGIVDTVGIGLLFPFFASFSDGTANNRVLLGTNASSGARPIVVAAGSNVFSPTFGSSPAGQFRKVGMVYKQDDFIAAFNGSLTPADNTGNVPSGINQVAFNGQFFVGTISSIRYYKKRLPNAKLQALTT